MYFLIIENGDIPLWFASLPECNAWLHSKAEISSFKRAHLQKSVH